MERYSKHLSSQVTLETSVSACMFCVVQFNPFTKLVSDTQGYRKSPSFGDTAHCVVFVVDASTVDVYSDKILHVVKEFQETANARGIVYQMA